MTDLTALTQAELAEVCSDLRRVAVVVVDMQADFCDESGAFARAGVDISVNRSIVAGAADFVDALRSRGARVVWIRQGMRRDYLSPAIERRLRRAPERLELCLSGTAGAELADGLRPHPEDLVVHKFRYSAFAGSCLDQSLRSVGISTVVLLGTAANACVDSTARDAAQLDYDVVVVRDLTGYTDPDLARFSLLNLDRHFAIVCEAADVLSAPRSIQAPG